MAAIRIHSYRSAALWPSEGHEETGHAKTLQAESHPDILHRSKILYKGGDI